MEQLKRASAPLLYAAVGILSGLALIGCGSGGSSGSSTSSTDANSLSDLPSTSTIVNGGGTSSSLSAKSLGKAVTGTPPLLKDITTSNIDTYFWNGLLATLDSTAVGSITAAQRNAFWQGEGACRMAQAVGYAFQNLQQAGTSLCYMQNAPLSANGVSITSGSATAANIFDQGAANKVVKVTVSNFSSNISADKSTGKASGSGPEDIFIKVYGTGSSEGSSGYAADLWFCSSAGTVGGYEEIRVNNIADTLALTSVHKDFGSFVASIAASLSTNASGQATINSSKDRSASVTFISSEGVFTFLGSVNIDSASLLTARDYSVGTFNGSSNVNKHAVFANYDGDTMDTLRFLEASFALQDTFGGDLITITDATEYQTNYYANVDSGSLLTTARSENFSSDLYSGTSSSQYTTAQTKLSATSSFSCSTTPDVIVAMDFSQSGPTAVKSQCENHYDDNGNMNFCDGGFSGSSLIERVRTKVFQSESLQNGSCSTTRCPYALDGGVNTGTFACQQWADNNRGNSAGITTLNATCNTSNCCAAQ